MMAILAEHDTKVKDPSKADLRRESERLLWARPQPSLTGIPASHIGGRAANSGLQSPISPAMARDLPVCLTVLPSESRLFASPEGDRTTTGSFRLPYPAASACSSGEILALGLLGAVSLLTVGYGFLCGMGLVGNWALFQAGIERLVQ